jgi:hypothetical protein
VDREPGREGRVVVRDPPDNGQGGRAGMHEKIHRESNEAMSFNRSRSDSILFSKNESESSKSARRNS